MSDSATSDKLTDNRPVAEYVDLDECLLVPVRDRVLIRPLEEPPSVGGLARPDGVSRVYPFTGVVEAVGPEVVVCAEGDVVLLGLAQVQFMPSQAGPRALVPEDGIVALLDGPRRPVSGLISFSASGLS